MLRRLMGRETERPSGEGSASPTKDPPLVGRTFGAVSLFARTTVGPKHIHTPWIGLAVDRGEQYQ